MTNACSDERSPCNESVSDDDQRTSCVEWIPGTDILVDYDDPL